MSLPYEKPQPIERLYQTLYDEGALERSPQGLTRNQMIEEISGYLVKTESCSALHFITYCALGDEELQSVAQVYERHISPRPKEYNGMTDDDKLVALRLFAKEEKLTLRIEELCKIQLRTED
ncbi:MAG TPA: hypothetical protein PKG74_02995 [Candidatus Colwellbacteria bacterium]|nr:hypothetical protein [Candidatus Colwellbacteria bacterium]